jgi:3-isopropylmalate/(R)-2-methylmalate dehydratase small subunit
MNKFETVIAPALPITRPNFDTDQIIPARFLNRLREDGFGECLFRDLRFTADGTPRTDFVMSNPVYSGIGIVVGERNFGCGSSREHAVWALADYGVRAVIAPSFGDIFYSNSLKNGLLPVRLPPESVAGLLAQLLEAPGANVTVDLQARTVTFPQGEVHGFELDDFSRHCLLNGVDELDFTLAQADQITAFEHRFGRENT